MMVDRLVWHDSAGVLALCVLFTLIGTIMGFILLGGKIYDTRVPGGMTNALGWTPLRSTQKDLRFYEESLVVMRNSRVLIHIPGREPEDNLAGWPGLAYTERTDGLAYTDLRILVSKVSWPCTQTRCKNIWATTM